MENSMFIGTDASENQTTALIADNLEYKVNYITTYRIYDSRVQNLLRKL
jgi:hypothetical protein